MMNARQSLEQLSYEYSALFLLLFWLTITFTWWNTFELICLVEYSFRLVNIKSSKKFIFNLYLWPNVLKVFRWICSSSEFKIFSLKNYHVFFFSYKVLNSCVLKSLLKTKFINMKVEISWQCLTESINIR